MIKELKIITLGNILRILILLFTPKIMTSIFSPAQMGEYYLIIASLSLVSLFIINPIGIYVNRNTINWLNDKTLESRLGFLSFKLFPILILLLGFIYIITNKVFNVGESYSIELITLLFLVLVFKTNNETYSSSLNILNKRIPFIFSQTLTPFLTILFLLIFNFFYKKNISIWFLSLLISNSLIFIYLLNFLKKLELNKKFKWPKRNLISFSSPLILSNLFMWFVFEGYRFILEKKIDPVEFGVFVVGFGLASQIISSLDSIYSQYLGPYLTNWMTGNNLEIRHKKIDDFLLLTISLYSIGLILIIIFSEYIFNILIDEKFSNGVIFFKAGLFFEFFKSMTNQIKNIGYSENNNNYTFLGYLIGGITFYTLYIYDSFSFQTILVVSSIIVFLFSSLLMNKLIKTPKLFLFTIVIVLYYLSELVFFNFNSFILQLFVLIILCVSTLILNKDLFNKLIK
ncbi:hypothetical protein N9H53_00695 [Flavobacteriaceae bacterium]|nr:hypothetical protein [Flavobacteriaceae bacterium]